MDCPIKSDVARAYDHLESVGLNEVAVARPRLPNTDEILPFLREIDMYQWYSNFGPLNSKWQTGLSAYFGGAGVVCWATATSGLAAALMAQDAPRGSLCAVPAWTFAASAHAIVMAGLVPWIVDVDVDTQQLTPQAMHEYLPSAPSMVGAVMPVMPFGSPMDLASWDQFNADTGVPVVVDAAAAFDTLRPSLVPAVVSLHATKVLGIGEGGLVTSRDEELLLRIGRILNFGFLGSREATILALNGKLSEYGAAIGLAALADWTAIRSDFLRVGSTYRAALEADSGAVLQDGYGCRWVSSTCVVKLVADGAMQTAQRLAASGIATRRWWGRGLHRHTAFAGFPCTALPATETLAETQLGLPCWRDLPDDTIRRICGLLRPSGAACRSIDRTG